MERKITGKENKDNNNQKSEAQQSHIQTNEHKQVWRNNEFNT